MRIAPAITLTEEQRERLQTCARSRSLPRRLVERAEMILLASEGRQNEAIALTLRRGAQCGGSLAPTVYRERSGGH